MIEQRCSTCRHWTPDDNRWSKRIHVRIEGPYTEAKGAESDRREAEVERLYNRCSGVPEIPDGWDQPPLAYTMDASEYSATLFTQADFGCVLHEPKENADA